ncbi:MAG: GNAT family N-acetyltransferase [Parachlamydiaceae bacterium]|nr:GNAT family N-acetyltransferase [Parachlamydiaceae bacterium]
MYRLLTNIEVKEPDFCHNVGQILIKPLSILCGRSFRVADTIDEIPTSSTLKKIIIISIDILLLPLTLISGTVGAVFLKFSASHKQGYDEVIKRFINIIWKDGKPEIHTLRLVLRPIKAEDLPVYKKLFLDATAMEYYAGGVRDITDRFNNWLERWKLHSFSALAVVDSKVNKVIGHVISGHGDYENNFEKGWSEIAIVIDPAYWNSDFKNKNKGIGTAGKRNIGTEVLRASVGYLKFLKDKSLKVPSDVTPEQRIQLVLNAEDKIADTEIHRNKNSEIDWVYLPLTQIRASAHVNNQKGTKMLEKVFIQENHGEKKFKSSVRDLFTINLGN